MRKTPFLLGIVCAFTLCLLSQVGKSKGTTDPTYQATIPFELITKHILINLKVNNSRPLSFIFDTGDKFAIIDMDRAKELALSLQGDIQSGAAGAGVLHGSYVQGSLFTMPGLEGFSQPITLAFPLKNLESPLGHEIDGVIGGDFIKEFVVELDYQSHVVRLYDKGAFDTQGRDKVSRLN